MLTRIAKASLVVLFAGGVALGQEIPEEVSNKDLGRKALEVTLSYVRSRDSDIRSMAADVLGQAGNKSAAGILRKMLSDSDKHTRIAAAEALWELGDTSGMKIIFGIIGDAPAQGPENSSPLAELKIISHNKIRERAIEAFARIKRDKAADMLFKLKNDRFGSIRDAAARELARLGHTEELTQFLEAIAGEDESMRFQGASILAKICAQSAAEPLSALLTPANSMRVRIAALDAIKCAQGGKTALPELLKLSDDPNPTLKFKAVSALSSIRDKKAYEKLKAITDATPDLSLKIAALKGLAAAGEKADAELLERAFDSARQDVKLEALKALYLVPDADAKRCFLLALSDNDAPVRLEAALQILRRFGKPTAP